MLSLTYQRRALHFNFPARTSRGALSEHVVYYLGLRDSRQPQVVGWGEAAPLAGLSPEYGPGFEPTVEEFCHLFNQAGHAALSVADAALLVPATLPSLRFALETAVLDLAGGGRRQLYGNSFSRGQTGLPINGLVWMGDAAFMRAQIRQKLNAGYACLKVKIGSLDFDTELALLAEIRAEASAAQLMLRVDANGAFTPAEAPTKLAQLARFGIHSIEQPIAARQWPALAALCRESPIPVALDEELIELTDPSQQEELIDVVRPPYLVLKPTLLGGHAATRRWIALAEARGIAWWITSALESNIGLNAVAQLTGEYAVDGFAQGLGTGQLYDNNLAAPLSIRAGELQYDPDGPWQLP
jgi:O-succinylbenzoate synthase